MKRTSVTHPLEIASVSCGPALGRIGITFCPGKYQKYAATGSWDRDLSRDLDVIKEWGAAAVVTLLEPPELIALRVEALGDEVRRRDMSWFHLPIHDYSLPGEAFKQGWRTAGPALLDLLRKGSSVVVHCKGGLGRAGTIAAQLLVELGTEPEAAISQVRQARSRAIETDEQLDYVRHLRAAT